MSLTFHSALGKLNTEPSRHVDASYQVSLHMAKAKKYICVFTVTCQKNLGSVGRDYYFFSFFLLLSTKPEIVVPSSGIRFRYLIFENSGKMTNYAVFLPSLLSISTKS